MITKTINLYQFEELNKEAQQKAIKYFQESEDFPFLADDLLYKLNELLAENRIKHNSAYAPKVFYSLSHCQGDGAMFEGDFTWKEWNVQVKHSGRYYHEQSKQITLIKDDIEITSHKDFYYEQFDKIYINICKELARYGYDVMETALSEENIIDMIKANDYTFTENGELENLV